MQCRRKSLVRSDDDAEVGRTSGEHCQTPTQPVSVLDANPMGGGRQVRTEFIWQDRLAQQPKQVAAGSSSV
jgi:hypothetical protein